MKLQQICRFRLGVQERNSGYQTSGASNGITPGMEDEFADKVKTIKMSQKDKDRPPVLEWSCNQAGKAYYLICVSCREDAFSRPTPLPHGIIISEQDAEALMSNPGKFMSFSAANFIYSWDAKDLTKKQLPELDELALDSGYYFSMSGIQKKYQLTNEQFKQLLYHIYEIVLSDGVIESFSFIWDGPKAGYVDVMRDMMYVVYSSIPMMLKSRISFASDKLEGMVTRMFTVADSAGTGSWFNLNTGESSGLQEFTEDNRYRAAFVEYLAEYAGTAEVAELLEWMDEFAQRIYRRPDMKKGGALINVMTAAFLTWKKEISQQYFKPGQLIRAAHSMVILHADDREFLDDKIGEILQQGIMSGGKINNIQQANMQKLYVATDSQIYRNAYQMAVALKDQESVYKSLISALKEESNEVTDNFIAFLLTKLPKTAQVQTKEVIDGLSKRYYVTNNQDLQSYYLEYVKSKYEQELSDDAIDAMLLPAFQNLAQQEPGTKAYERASAYLQYQLDTLLAKKRKASDTVLEKMASQFGSIPSGELKTLFIKYTLNCYLFRFEDEAVEYYEKLRVIGGPLFEEVEEIFYSTENKVLDIHFVRKLYPSRKNDTLKDQIRLMEMVVKFPVWNRSCQVILNRTHDLCVQMMKKEAAAPKDPDAPLAESLHNTYVSIDRALAELNQISGSRMNAQIGEIRQECRNIYWDFMEVGVKTNACLKYTEMHCDHPKCRMIYKYHEILKELKDRVSMGRFDMPENSIELLTTDAFTNNAKQRNYLIRKYLIDQVQGYQKPSMEADCLLVMNYDNEKGRFANTAFLKDMTKEQWEQLEMGSLMLQLHPELNAEMEAYQKKVSRSNVFKKFIRNPKARIGLLAAGIVILLAGGTVLAVNLIGVGKGGDDGTKEVVQTGDAVMTSANGTEAATEGTSGESEAESKTEESSAGESRSDESSTPESSAESSGAAAAATLSREEYEAAFTVKLGENQFGLEDDHVYNMTNGKRLATNGEYSLLKTDGTYLYCIKDGKELRRYDNPGTGSLDTDTMKKIGIAGKAAAYEVTEKGIVYLLTSDGKVYRIDPEAGTEPEEILEHVTSLVYDGGNLYTAQEKSVYCYVAEQASPGKETDTWKLSESPNELYVESGTTGYLVSGIFYIYEQKKNSAEAYVVLDMKQPYSMVDGCLYGVMKKAGSKDKYREGRFDLENCTISWIAE